MIPQRNENIDKLKGLTILLMLVGHCGSIWDTTLFYIIFSFHMPLFFIVSGYFFKPKDTGTVVRGCINKLAKPYILTSIAICAFSFIAYGYEKGIDSIIGVIVGCKGSWAPLISTRELQSGPLWFILALFWCKIYYHFLYRRTPNHLYLLSISLFLLFFFWQFGTRIMNLPLCLGCAFTGLFFYEVGAVLRKYDINQIPWSYKILIYIIWIVAFKFSYLNMAQYVYTRFPLSVMGAVCGTIAVYDITKLIKGKVAGILFFLGRYTLEIVCCHTVAWATRYALLAALSIEKSTISIDIAYEGITIVLSVIVIAVQCIRQKIRE